MDFLLILLCFFFSFGLYDSARTNFRKVDISVSNRKDELVVSDKFLSFNFASILLNDKPPHQRFNKFDFKSQKVIALLSGLSPAYMRFGGSAVDRTVFVNEDIYVDKRKGGGGVSKWKINKKEVFNFLELCNTTGNRLLWDLNLQLRRDGKWNPNNAKLLLDYISTTKLMTILDLELGNEPTRYKHKNDLITLNGAQIGEDYITLKQLMLQYKDLNESSLVGPALSGSSGQDKIQLFKDFINTCGKEINAVTTHHYYLNAEESSISDYVKTETLKDLTRTINKVYRIIGETAYPLKDLWLGETGASHSEDKTGITVSYGSGFVWLDKLGKAAELGVKIVIRQTIYGPKSLLNDDMEPNPDYWISYMHKRLVGEKVLNVIFEKKLSGLRVYSHCSKHERNSVTLFALNLRDEIVTIRLKESHNLKIFKMTPGDVSEGLLSKTVSLNDQILKINDDYSLPALESLALSGSEVILEPRTYVFFTFKLKSIELCGA